jgi:hypothetical protein
LPKSARAPTYLNYPRPSPEIAANAHNGSPLMLRYLMYTAAARWPGQLLGRSTTRRLAALIPIQRGRHGLQSISTAPLHSACPGRPSTNQPLGSNSSATLLATSRWWRVFESVNAETERPTQPHLGDHGGTRTPPQHGAQIIFVRRCSGHECVIHDYPAILVALAVEGPADLRPWLRGGGSGLSPTTRRNQNHCTSSGAVWQCPGPLSGPLRVIWEMDSRDRNRLRLQRRAVPRRRGHCVDGRAPNRVRWPSVSDRTPEVPSWRSS